MDVMRQQYRALTPVEKEQLSALKDKAIELYDLIDSINGGREVALAKTKLEEAVMWATKALTS